MLKRAFDIIVAVVCMWVLSLPLVVVALIIRAIDGSPVLYRQLRIGRNGRTFWLYKYRTMKPSIGGSSVTVGGDPRVTPLGTFLRRWKLDELPQLWNILKGEMGVVGPRPEAARLACHYTPEQWKILAATPGLAGFSQLVYPHEGEMLRRCADPEQFYATELMPRKIAADLEYERSRTLLTDLRLLLEIVLLIASGKSRHIRNDIPCCTTVERHLSHSSGATNSSHPITTNGCPT